MMISKIGGKGNCFFYMAHKKLCKKSCKWLKMVMQSVA